MAEPMLNHLGSGRFRAFSAGSDPTGRVHPWAVLTLQQLHVPADGLRSKSWNEFAEPGAPPLDFVFTVCDKADGEACPLWPGQPMTAHWGVPDPVPVEGSDEIRTSAFLDAALTLRRRIELMLALPLTTLAGLALQQELDRIGTVQRD